MSEGLHYDVIILLLRLKVGQRIILRSHGYTIGGFDTPRYVTEMNLYCEHLASSLLQ